MIANLLRSDIMTLTLDDFIEKARVRLAEDIPNGDFDEADVLDFAGQLIRTGRDVRELELGWHLRKAEELGGRLSGEMRAFVTRHWPEVEHYTDLLSEWDAARRKLASSS